MLKNGNAKRIYATDVGNRRVGVARADVLGILASAVGMYERSNILQGLKKLDQSDPVGTFVVGWPLSLSGEEGKAVHMVRSFIGELKKAFPDVEVVTLDERFTSVLAQRSIIDSGAKKKKRRDKGNVDAVAATILLQNYLDQRRNF